MTILEALNRIEYTTAVIHAALNNEREGCIAETVLEGASYLADELSAMVNQMQVVLEANHADVLNIELGPWMIGVLESEEEVEPQPEKSGSQSVTPV
jgi:hypothetical protein